MATISAAEVIRIGRKRIEAADHPSLDASYHGLIGPKGMAIMEGELDGTMVRRPLTDLIE